MRTSNTLPLNHRDSKVCNVYYNVHMTRILHATKTHNVDGIMFVNRGEMISFDLSKEIEKDVFSSCHRCGTKKKLSPHEDMNLRPLMLYH